MSITRTPMIDDDGSGTTGTIINNAWKQELYNQIDAQSAGVAAPTVVVTADTGTLNDWRPAGLDGQSRLIYWYGNAATTLTGIGGGGVDGQTVTIKNRGSNGAVLSCAYFHSGSAAVNRLLPLAASAPTPVAVEGWATFTWIAAAQAWVMTGHEQGAWITPAFNAADYVASSGGPWVVEAGDVFHAKYRLQGRTLTWSLLVFSTALAANGGLTRRLFGGFTVPGLTYAIGSLIWEDGSGAAAAGSGYCQHTAPDTIVFYKANSAAVFVAGAVRLNASGICEVG